MESRDVGILLNQNNIKLQREYFKKMLKLIGIKTIYRAPRPSKTYNGYGELDEFFYEPIEVGCIFVDHPNQWTMKKLGWNTELSEDNVVIQVPYDTPMIQRGAIFELPSAIDNAKSRKFMVLDNTTIAVTPACITCRLGPVFESTFESSEFTHKNNDFNLLDDEEDN